MQMLVILRQKAIIKITKDKLKKLKKAINNILKADLVQKIGLTN